MTKTTQQGCQAGLEPATTHRASNVAGVLLVLSAVVPMVFLVPWAHRWLCTFCSFRWSSSASSPEIACPRTAGITTHIADVKDLPTVVKVINDAFMVNAFFKKEGYTNRTSLTAAQSWVSSNHIYLVALNQQHVILGAVAVEWDNTTLVGEIGQLSVQKAQREKGIGKLLVKAAEDWAAQQAGDRPFTIQMPLLNVRPDLFPFYEKQGYSAGERIPYPNNEVLNGLHEVDLIMYRRQFAAPLSTTFNAPTAKTPVPWYHMPSVGLGRS
eukprot:GGOE01036711.1.p1 GENE.GGOE01036711.1~~GGOE01036711.1.p1  ORF type:complete len:268 (-),score=24.87 GGOE01036711.1:219-1022(-)